MKYCSHQHLKKKSKDTYCDCSFRYKKFCRLFRFSFPVKLACLETGVFYAIWNNFGMWYWQLNSEINVVGEVLICKQLLSKWNFCFCLHFEASSWDEIGSHPQRASTDPHSLMLRDICNVHPQFLEEPTHL